MFVIREALRSIRRSPISIVLIALTVGVGVGLTAVFAYVAYSAHESLAAIERSMTIDVYFDPIMTNEQASTIFEQEIARSANVATARFITKEDALKEYEAGTGQDVRSVIGENPLPAGGSITLKHAASGSIEKKINELKAIAGIADVVADQALSASLTEKSQMLDKLTTWLGVLMALVILIVVAVATRLTVEMRRHSLRIMRLLGGSRWKVNAPFILEGFFAGSIGGMIASLLLLALDELALRTVLPGFDRMPPDFPVVATIALLLISCALGVLGSATSLLFKDRG